MQSDAEREIAFRAKHDALSDVAGDRRRNNGSTQVPLRLDSRERGHLDTLHFVPFQMPSCEPGRC